MKKISEYLFLWGIGGWIYYSLEIIFRDFHIGPCLYWAESV